MSSCTYAFDCLADSVLGAIVRRVRRAAVPGRGLLKWDFFEKELAKLTDDAHLLAELLEAAKLEAQGLLDRSGCQRRL